MSLGVVLGKRTWITVALGVVLLLLWTALGALLVTKGVLPLTMVDGWLYGGCGMTAFAAGFFAGKGKGGRLASLAAVALLYGILWAAALASSQPLSFQPRGLGITLAMLGGGMLSCMLRSGRRKKRHRVKASAVRRRAGSAT